MRIYCADSLRIRSLRKAPLGMRVELRLRGYTQPLMGLRYDTLTTTTPKYYVNAQSIPITSC